MTGKKKEWYFADGLDPRSLVEGAVCALCGERPAECLQIHRFQVGPKRRTTLEQLLAGVCDDEAPFQADAHLLVVACGTCHDEVSNERLRRYGYGGGYDFRSVRPAPHESMGGSCAAGERLFREIAESCRDTRAMEDR